MHPAAELTAYQGCPKHMVFGPCGGVRADGGCEMIAMPCVFGHLDQAISWPATSSPPTPVRVPLVLTDLSVPAADAATLTATAKVLAASCEALLVGDHQDRLDFPPSLLARLISDAGSRPWVTLACRDRTRVVLEQELQALAHDGLATVLCVTGDGRAYDVRPDAPQAFDLDGTRLAALAASVGLPVAVPEAPAAPPRHLRPERLVVKERAGAGAAVLNHVGSMAQVAAFIAAAREAGLRIPVIASVAVYTDERSANVLTALPGLQIHPDTVASVLRAADPVAAGIEVAVTEALSLLAVEGVAGVNLSGMASARGAEFAAQVQAEIGHRIKESAGSRAQARSS